ncbi:MAG: chromosomal replication initiator protein DnaA [Muribaculaceae bacterium]|nr:chromosomal replication initiator protein DnaA [Muribaculaceae bacterium]MDE7386271.1 chromosomal replication initiator protein DnaA [Muribaculaceae bacterium]
MPTLNCTYNWNDCLEIFKDNLPPDQYASWFEPVSVVSFIDGNLTLSVPSPYFVEHLEEKYLGIIGSVLRRVYGEGVNLYYQYEQVQNQPATKVDVKSENRSRAIKEEPVKANPFQAPAPVSFDSQLNPHYTFENYCGSISNRLALSIGATIANDPKSTTFNPLFLFGPSGVGKTHLVQAIGIRIKEQNPDARVLYINARLFESQCTAALRNGRINDFMAFYQSIDVLIIDDIQDLIDKERTQVTFFHIFNQLHLNNKRIILTSDCRPSQLKGMPDRMLTRLKWGMTVELERPDLELRKEVLRRKAAVDGLSISNDILDFIAENVTGSIRELEGIIVSLLAHATVLSREITIDLARTVMSNAVKVARKQINFEMITQSVSAYYNIEPDDIFTKSRKREISDARQMVMFLSKKHAKMPLTAIGTRLSRTHATVLYACKNIEERLPIEKQLQEDVAKIESELLK